MYIKKLGLDETSTRDSRPNTIGKNVNWLSGLRPYIFDQVEFENCIKEFQFDQADILYENIGVGIVSIAETRIFGYSVLIGNISTLFIYDFNNGNISPFHFLIPVSLFFLIFG